MPKRHFLSNEKWGKFTMDVLLKKKSKEIVPFSTSFKIFLKLRFKSYLYGSKCFKRYVSAVYVCILGPKKKIYKKRFYFIFIWMLFLFNRIFSIRNNNIQIHWTIYIINILIFWFLKKINQGRCLKCQLLIR